jgi:hypothetical protein
MERFNATKLNLSLIAGDPYIAFERTLCWNPKALLRMELIGAGFGFLNAWEIAAPLYSYDELAVHIGSDEARARTQAVMRDLRVPVIDTRLLYVRHCENTKRLFDQWAVENETGDDERLTFMRAFYAVKPLALMLPVTWHTPAAYSEAA